MPKEISSVDPKEGKIASTLERIGTITLNLNKKIETKPRAVISKTEA